ncbi:Spt2 protein [Martiniozyma asiatica (nom. inval.)]|nr:Spt2 protein [Martiniozyma asiatica]
MGFAALLNQVTSDKKVAELARREAAMNAAKISRSSPAKKSAPTAAGNGNANGNAKGKTTYRAQAAPSITVATTSDDPAVRRLKEARRKEMDRQLSNKKPVQKSNRKLSPSTTASANRMSANSKERRQPIKQLQQQQQKQPPPPIPMPMRIIKGLRRGPPLPSKPKSTTQTTKISSAAPKLSFKELMKKAETVDLSQPKLAKITPQKSEPSKSLQSIKKVKYQNTAQIKNKKSGLKQLKKPQSIKENVQKIERKPVIPQFAKPSAELQRRLAAKRAMKKPSNPHPYAGLRVQKPKDSYGIEAEDDEFDDYDLYSYGDDYEDDGFIVDDENEDYARRELNNMLGKKRKYNDFYDDYDDDMEATGADIFEEEEMALRAARLEDKREQQMLERRAQEKRKLKAKK